MGTRCTASQKHTTAASSSALPRPAAASPGHPSPRWRPTGSGWSDGHCCGCCSALVHPSSRWSCSGRCGIRPGVPSSPCIPPPLSHQILPRWTTGLTSCSKRQRAVAVLLQKRLLLASSPAPVTSAALSSPMVSCRICPESGQVQALVVLARRGCEH